MKKILIGVCILAATASVASAGVGRLPSPRWIPPLTRAEDAADSLYRLGRQAINDDNYERAVAIFRQVVDRFPKSSSGDRAV